MAKITVIPSKTSSFKILIFRLGFFSFIHSRQALIKPFSKLSTWAPPPAVLILLQKDLIWGFLC
jgi:hypothetical protein